MMLMIPKGRAGGWEVIPPIFMNIINTTKILQNITNVKTYRYRQVFKKTTAPKLP